MFKKAQGLPMSTIIIIILVLFVLAGVGIFFFTQFGAGGEGASQAQCIQMCQTIKSQIASIEEGSWADVQNSDVAVRFCEGHSVPEGCVTMVQCKVLYDADNELSDIIGSTNAGCS